MQLVTARLDSIGLNQQTTRLTRGSIAYLSVFIHNIYKDRYPELRNLAINMNSIF